MPFEKFEYSIPAESLKEESGAEKESNFVIERLDPESPDFEKDLMKTQELFTREFSRDEVDNGDPEKARKWMEDPEEPYRITVVRNKKNEIIGASAGTDLHLRDEEGGPLDSKLFYLSYLFFDENFRSQGHGSKDLRWEVLQSLSDADKKEERVKGMIVEAAPKAEAFYNRLNFNDGMRRLYCRNEKDQWVEAPYEQIPIHWNEKTGKPTGEPVREHLMYVPLSDYPGTISGEELAGMVRTIHYYNEWDEEDFRDPQAYEKHEETIEGYIERFSDFAEGKTFHLFGKSEREQMIADGSTFMENKNE